MEDDAKLTIEHKLEKIPDVFRGSRIDAANILSDPEMAEKVLGDAFLKAEGLCKQLQWVEEHLRTFLELSGDYISGKYEQIPRESMVNIFASIIYLMIPMDLLPDFIPPIGYIDDALIIGLVTNEEKQELQKYRNWKGDQS